MCCTKARATAAFKEEDWNEEWPQEKCSFWQPFSLEFANTSREKEFRDVTYPAWHVQDFVAHCLAFILGPVVLCSMKDLLPAYYLGIVAVMVFIFPLLHIFLHIKNRDAFVRYRICSLVLVRVVMTLVFMGFGFFAEVPEASITAIVGEIVTKSPVAHMLFTSMIHREMFKRHLIIHALAFVESLLWIPLFCRICAADANIKDTLSKIGYGIDGFFSYTFLNTAPDPASYPCWMISATIMATVGFCLPTLLVFVAEVSSRAIFVKSRVSAKAHSALYAYTSQAIKVGILAFVVIAMGTWFLLTHAAKLLC